VKRLLPLPLPAPHLAHFFPRYHRVVHLDMDSLPLQNMDELFAGARSLVYTADYNMGYKPHPPVQGGFAVVAPDAAVHAALWALVRKGAYRKGEGWNKSGIGRFWGGATFQGLLPYYFYAVAPPEASAEVDRCVYVERNAPFCY